MVKIKTFEFNENISNALRKEKGGTNWPVVYIINNQDEAYVGESTDASIRASQHLGNELRRRLDTFNVITDDTFNKSSALDLESFLIKYMAADGNFKLQNGNAGLLNHNYYQREVYFNQFKNIWNQLKKEGLVKKELRSIENSDLFKYSPYKSLTNDQYMIVYDILELLKEDIVSKEESVFLVNGGAGTGKTILGIYIMKMLADNDTYDHDIETQISFDNKLEIALVIPMDNLRKTLKKVFKSIKGLNPNMVLSPNDVAKGDKEYDLLIVDEAHRLRRRVNLTQYPSFDKNNERFNLGKEGTELDWIRIKSKHQIFFYDESQSIKPTDVRKDKFNDLLYNENYHRYTLETQLRCLTGGNEYIDYIKSIFSNSPPEKNTGFKEYDLRLFNHVNEMIEMIKILNTKHELCRNIAGYAWKWETSKRNKNKQKDFDIEIEGYRYIWNTVDKDWINSKNSINEIGSIHTTQGFDLNYAGIIIGNELKYDKLAKKLYVDRNKYYDKNGKNTANDEELLQYVLNIYATLCTRGMLGTYLYACDKDLRDYLSEYI